MTNLKTINVSFETHLRLMEITPKNETYEVTIRKLLDAQAGKPHVGPSTHPREEAEEKASEGA